MTTPRRWAGRAAFTLAVCGGLVAGAAPAMAADAAQPAHVISTTAPVGNPAVVTTDLRYYFTTLAKCRTWRASMAVANKVSSPCKGYYSAGRGGFTSVLYDAY